MYNRLLFTVSTAACLMGVYAVYAVLTRPLVVIPEQPTATREPTQRAVPHWPAENVRVAQTFLAEQPWAAKSPYMLRSGPVFIYTQKWEHQPGDPRIRFVPFALVWLHKDEAGKEAAVSLVSDSAQLRFASDFDGFTLSPGRVVGAVLDGEVQVKGPDGLAILGKQFVFDESAPSLVSTHPVQFQYGTHFGRGHNLNMKLIPADGPPGKDRPHVYGVRTVRLGSGINPAEYVRLNVSLPPEQGQPQKPLKIQCAGDLEYDVLQQQATFSKSVRAYRWTGTSDYDALDCDELRMHFAPVVATTAPPPSNPDPAPERSFQHIDTDLEFRRLVATGQPVVARSTTNALRATMRRLEYDLISRRLQLMDANKVYVAYRESILTVPAIDVRLRENHSPGDIVCQGAGRLEQMRPGTSDVVFVATWAEQLRKTTDVETGLDIIELRPRAYVSQPLQRTALGAELIRVGMDPITAAPGPSTTKPESATEPRPRWLVARDNVALVSPKLQARTQELEVRLEDLPPRELSLADPPQNPIQLVHRVGDSTGIEHSVLKTPGSAVTRVAANAARNEPGSLGPPIDISAGPDRVELPGRTSLGPEPLDVRADRIQVRLQYQPKSDPEVLEVETEGRVKLVQARPGQPPFNAEGDRLHLNNRGIGREIVHLFGQPAHLRAGGLHVEGREVHLDRADNRVWVQGSGLLQLPVPPGTQLDTLGKAAHDPDLDVWWHESMVFDGSVAKFVGKVRAELGLSRMRCELMDVRLSTRLSFADKNPEKPELDTIHCREDVTFENSEYEGNRLTRVQRGRVAEFKFQRLQGTSFAQGPGQIQAWQRGRNAPPGNGPTNLIQANRPINSVSSDWDFTRVDFKGRMTGNLEPQRSTFHDSVLIVHGPVSLPNETIDPDHLPAQAGSMRCEKLEFTHQSKGPQNPRAYQQLVGWGNAQIEGRGFYANADEISFDGSKGLYMLRAHGNQSATIAQDTDQGPRHEAAGRRIEFIPATRTVKVDWATGASDGS